MALTRTLLDGGYNNADATSYNTASISPAANTSILLFYGTRHGTTAPDMTPSGVSGITWTKAGSQLDGISLLGCWHGAVGGSPGTGALTLTMDGGVTAIGCSWSIEQVSGQDTSGTIVQTVFGATGSTGTASSVTFAAAGAAANRFWSYHIHRANEVTNPRTNWTELDDRSGTAPNMGFELQWRDDGTNETTGSASWTTSARWQAMGVEVKAASAGSVSLAGASDGTSTATASMILAIALVASSAGTSTATASMILAIALNALSAGTSTATGTLAGLVPLVASSAGTSTATASMRLALALIASSAGTSTASASMLVGTLVALAAASAGSSQAFADLGFVIPEPRVVMVSRMAWRHGRRIEIYSAHTVPG